MTACRDMELGILPQQWGIRWINMENNMEHEVEDEMENVYIYIYWLREC